MEGVLFFVDYLGFASSVAMCGRHVQEKQWGVKLERHWLGSAAPFFTSHRDLGLCCYSDPQYPP